MLEVREISGRGRGVVTTERLRRDDLVHVAPVIVLTWRESIGKLAHYVWSFPNAKRGGHASAALALGLGSLFNHSRNDNLCVTFRPARLEIAFWAKRDIDAGEELTVDYGYEPRGYDGR